MNTLRVILLVVIIAALFESVEMKKTKKTNHSSSSKSSSKSKSTKSVRCAGKFQCTNGTCLTMDKLCDTHDDCDGEDEAVCPPQCTDCGAEKFKCKNGTCITRDKICDGDQDCDEGEDESGCPATCTDCGAEMFKCKNGTCITRDQICDGEEQCGEGEDESGCPETGSTCRSCVYSTPLCSLDSQVFYGENNIGSLYPESTTSDCPIFCDQLLECVGYAIDLGAGECLLYRIGVDVSLLGACSWDTVFQYYDVQFCDNE